MKLLLDEDVPKEVLAPIRHLVAPHQVDHVDDLRWKGKKDRFLLMDAGKRGYHAFVTNDSTQLESVEEARAIRDSGMHHISYRHETRRGREGLALAIAGVLASVIPIIRELEQVEGQRLVEIQAIRPRQRHTTTNPTTHPPRYWSRRRK
ncbi:MAG TPA: hypothetical protein VLK34_08210 [Nocardioidaceae bacterium]|nr:hypothetical protein [Nocardioidaceae bacterium]